MRKQLITLTLGLLLGLSTLTAKPASALSCMHPHDLLPGYALIVQGKVEKVAPRLRLPGGPTPADDITLTVSHYFKGEGPATLEAVFDGLGWETMSPVGSEVIMGFMVGEDGEYTSGACSLRISAQPSNEFETELIQMIKTQNGEGRAPNPSAGPVKADGPRGVWVLWASMGALAALVGGLWLRRRAKRSN